MVNRQISEEGKLIEGGERAEAFRIQVLQRRKDGRADAGLKEVDGHQGQGVARQRLVLGVVDAGKLGPRLHKDHQRPDSPVELKKTSIKKVKLKN